MLLDQCEYKIAENYQAKDYAIDTEGDKIVALYKVHKEANNHHRHGKGHNSSHSKHYPAKGGDAYTIFYDIVKEAISLN